MSTDKGQIDFVRGAPKSPFPPRKMVEITCIKKETANHTSLGFLDKEPVQPGQFLMVWLPGMREIPMGYSLIGQEGGGRGAEREITIHDVGPVSKALCGLKEGDKLWVRGPLGKGFILRGKKILVVGGGCGMSPLTPLVELAASSGVELETAIGAITAEELLMVDRLASVSKVHLATDDGSRGYKGFVTEIVGDLLASGEFDMVYTCGPEKMMATVVKRCHEAGISCQASLERYMKCGIGICDSCAISGLRVCADGPVFTGEELVGIEEFGRWRRGPDGSRMPI